MIYHDKCAAFEAEINRLKKEIERLKAEIEKLKSKDVSEKTGE